MMMRNCNVPDRLARNRLFDLFDRLQRDAIVTRSLHHKDVIVEIDKQNVIATGAGRIDLFSMLRDGRRRRKRDCTQSFRHLEALGCELDIEGDVCESEVVRYVAVQNIHATSGHDVLTNFALAGKARLEKRIA